MVSIEIARAMALAYEGAEELPHFEKASFRIKKKIFATIDEVKRTMVLKLNLEQQYLFSASDETVVYPVPGGWGRQGYTVFELKKVRKQVLADALTTAYINCAPKGLAAKYREHEN